MNSNIMTASGIRKGSPSTAGASQIARSFRLKGLFVSACGV